MLAKVTVVIDMDRYVAEVIVGDDIASASPSASSEAATVKPPSIEISMHMPLAVLVHKADFLSD